MPTIKEILEQCQALWTSLLALKESLDGLQITLAEQQKAQEELQAKLDEQKKDLADREAAIAKIENIIELNKENNRLLTEIDQKTATLKRDTQAYDEHIAKENASLNERRTLISQDEETLKKGQEKLKKDTEQMEKDRTEFKKKVIEKIAASIT